MTVASQFWMVSFRHRIHNRTSQGFSPMGRAYHNTFHHDALFFNSSFVLLASAIHAAVFLQALETDVVRALDVSHFPNAGRHVNLAPSALPCVLAASSGVIPSICVSCSSIFAIIPTKSSASICAGSS